MDAKGQKAYGYHQGGDEHFTPAAGDGESIRQFTAIIEQ
jgi:hypothetical protein